MGDIGYYTDSLQSLVNNFGKNIAGMNRLILMGDNFIMKVLKKKMMNNGMTIHKCFPRYLIIKLMLLLAIMITMEIHIYN